EFEIKQMAKTFKLSRSGYYKHVQKQVTERVVIDAVLTHKIKDIFEQNRRAYGSPRIYKVLKKQGGSCSRRKITALMKVHNMRVKSRKKWKVTNKACKDLTKIAPNLVKQQFTAPMVNHTWVSDIIYVRTKENWLYVAAVMDLFYRKIVGLAMG